jgi:protoheme IX farnesyltransferase
MQSGAGAQTAPNPTTATTRSVLPTVVRDYLTLTKPKVQSLLLFTTVTTMYVAGDPSLGLILLTCLGGALSAGGAGAINHAVDRDIDRTMARTATRPVASGRISPGAAIAFGLILAAASFLLLSLTVNPLAASLSFSGFVGYVGVYTLWLKRRTPQNIVIGGAAGAVPPLVGWAAATGNLTLPALALFAIVFFWTPPHFWALSLLMKDEYAKAGIPMLPVVRGEAETRRQILLYTVLLYAVTQLPFCAGGLGIAYVIPSILLGAAFIYCAARLMRSGDRRWALRTYLYSLSYLALLFLAMAVADRTQEHERGTGCRRHCRRRLRPLLRHRLRLHRPVTPWPSTDRFQSRAKGSTRRVPPGRRSSLPLASSASSAAPSPPASSSSRKSGASSARSSSSPPSAASFAAPPAITTASRAARRPAAPLCR